MKFLRVLLLLVFLTACTAQSTAPAGSPTKAPVADATKAPPGSTAYPGGKPPAGAAGYPAAGQSQAAGTAYPAVQNTPAKQAPTITPDSTRAIVKGRLLLNGKPAAGRILLLAKVIRGADGKDVALQLDRSTPLNSETDAQGNFAIKNVPADRYAVVIDNGQLTYALGKPGTADQLRADVTGNQTIDLGTLDYTELP